MSLFDDTSLVERGFVTFVKESSAANGSAAHLRERLAELEYSKMSGSRGSFPMDLSATHDSMDVTAVGDETPEAQLGVARRDVAHEWWNSQLSTFNKKVVDVFILQRP